MIYFAHEGMVHETTTEAIEHSASSNSRYILLALGLAVIATLAIAFVAARRKPVATDKRDPV